MKKIIIIIGIVAIVLVGYLIYNSNQRSKDSSITAAVETTSVAISSFTFNPSKILVKVRDSVVFKNEDGTSHTITADDGSFDESISAGATTTLQITKPGTYNYHCSIHSSMTGTITVK